MDKFFTQSKCDRCGGDLASGRKMSWFNDQTICTTKCSPEEDKLKMELSKKGEDTRKYEGCGYIPKVDVA